MFGLLPSFYYEIHSFFNSSSTTNYSVLASSHQTVLSLISLPNGFVEQRRKEVLYLEIICQNTLYSEDRCDNILFGMMGPEMSDQFNKVFFNDHSKCQYTICRVERKFMLLTIQREPLLKTSYIGHKWSVVPLIVSCLKRLKDNNVTTNLDTLITFWFMIISIVMIQFIWIYKASFQVEQGTVTRFDYGSSKKNYQHYGMVT